jgi:hypothetical protein
MVGIAVSSASAQNPPPGGGSWGIAGTDLAADRIEFILVQQYDSLGTKGRVRIRGVVTNRKGDPYHGNGYATLKEKVGTAWKRVAIQPIPLLAGGAVCDVVYERNWNKNAPAATAYLLAVELDGQDTDDRSNNGLVRSSEGLSELLQPVRQNPVMQTKTGSSPGGLGPKVNWPKSGSPWDKVPRR